MNATLGGGGHGVDESKIWRGGLFLLALGGFGVNLLLLVRRLSDGAATLAGCGAGSGCETVLGSQWSQVLGVPVTVPGLLVYVAVMLGLTRAGRSILAPILGLIVGAAVWFVFVQAVMIRAFCPWCMAAHAVGLTLAVLGLPFAARTAGTWMQVSGRFGMAIVASMAGLMLIQVYGPKPATHRVTDLDLGGTAGATMMLDAHSAGEGRLAVFFDGRKGYRVEQLPHLGRADAKHVLVEYFDYACGACQTMSGYLEALVEAYPEDVCVVMLPTPLDPDCNRSVSRLDAGHAGACEMARASLAVWREAPDSFPAFHQAVFAEPSAENARMLATALLPDAEQSMRGPWVEAVLGANLNDWEVISAENAKLPKLVLGNRRLLHGFPPTKAEFVRVIAAELGIE